MKVFFKKININKLNVIVLIDEYYLMFHWKVENNDLESLDQLFVLDYLESWSKASGIVLSSENFEWGTVRNRNGSR